MTLKLFQWNFIFGIIELCFSQKTFDKGIHWMSEREYYIDKSHEKIWAQDKNYLMASQPKQFQKAAFRRLN